MIATQYKLSDLVLSSAINLPELTPVLAEWDWTFTLSAARLSTRAPEWFQRWRLPAGRRTLSIARQSGGYLLRFHGFADFALDITRRSIVCWRRNNAPMTTVRHLLLDQVMPLVLSREDRLVLHAAGVATPRGAVALLGQAGAGKSTLAAALAASGFPLLTDDCLSLEPSRRGFLARPFYPGARLWPDSAHAVGAKAARSSRVAHYTRKRRVAETGLPFLDESVPLASVLVLDRRRGRPAPDAVTLTRLRGREAWLAVLGCTFQLDTGDPAAIGRGFDLQSRLVTTTPIYRVSYPWRLARLAETRDALRRELEADRL